MLNDLTIQKVTTRRQMTDFVRLAESLYRDCPQYMPDLERDVRDAFRPERNAGLKFCDVQPFIAYRREVPVGRIVGIVNRRANQKWGVAVVRFGMIEFIDDLEVSRALIDAVGQWGRERGMDCMQGPLGITDFDKEGMLVDDFELTGAMTSIYNPSYYPQHMEALGFRKAVDWLQVRIRIPREVPARYARVARLAREMFHLRVHVMTLNEARGDYARRVFALLNTCYAHLFGFTEFTTGQMENFMRQYLLLIDRTMTPVVENAEGEIVGVAVTTVSVAEALQRSHGRLWPLGWWRLFKALRLQRTDHAELLLVAVRPDYQGYGVNALFFEHLIPIYNQYGIAWAETGPQLEDNVRVLAQWKPLAPTVVKRRRCYQSTLNSK